MPCTAVAMVLKALVVRTNTFTYVHAGCRQASADATAKILLGCPRCGALVQAFGGDALTFCMIGCWGVTLTFAPIYAKRYSLDIGDVPDDEDITFNCWCLMALNFMVVVVVAESMWRAVVVSPLTFEFKMSNFLVNGSAICTQVFSGFFDLRALHSHLFSFKSED